MDDIKAAFKKYDADSSGTITLDEAHLVLQVMIYKNVLLFFYIQCWL